MEQMEIKGIHMVGFEGGDIFANHHEAGMIKVGKRGICDTCEIDKKEKQLYFFKGAWMCGTCLIYDLVTGDDEYIKITDDLLDEIYSIKSIQEEQIEG